METRLNRPKLLLLAILSVFGTLPSAQAANVKIKPVVVTGDAAPEGGTFTFIGSGSFSMNNSGAIAFSASTTNSGGIYLASDATIQKVIKPGDTVIIPICTPVERPVRGFNGPVIINDSGAIIFHELTSVGIPVLFSGGILSLLDGCPSELDLLLDLTEGKFQFVLGKFALVMNNTGTVVLSYSTIEGGAFNGRQFLYSDGALRHFPLVDGSIVDINDSGDLLLSSSQGFFFNSTPIALIGGQAGPGKTFRNFFGAPDLNNAGEVVFAAFLSDFSRAIFHWATGTLTPLVFQGDPAPAGRTFSSFHSVDINDKGDIVFDGEVFVAGGKKDGIFLLPAKGGLSKVVFPGDPAPGGGTFTVVGGSRINNKGQIAFNAALSDGRGGLFLASPGLETEFVDPVPDLLAGPTVTPDTAMLASNGRVVTGIAADGAARVVVRAKTGQPGTVEFSLVDESGVVLPPSDFNGSLSSVGEALGSGSVSVPAADVEGFGPMAFAAYHAPMDFSSGPNSKEAGGPDRKVFIKIKLTTSTGETVESTEPLKIVRPPVVLVHGLWADRTSWFKFLPLIGNANLSIYVANYKNSNARELSFNAPIVGRQIKGVIEAFKLEQQVAAVQADIVTHSMGGVIARMLPVFSSSFLRDDNFTKGDVHKLVNVGTPHFGSEFAEKLRTKKNRTICRSILSANNAPIDQGAIDDLSPGSDALRVINGFPSAIALHNNVGIASALQKEVNASGEDFTALQSFFVCGQILPQGGFDAVFNGDDNDLLVSATSQRAGLSPTSGAVSNFPPRGPNLIHTRADGLFDVADGEAELESPAVSSRFIQLLNLPVGALEFVRVP